MKDNATQPARTSIPCLVGIGPGRYRGPLVIPQVMEVVTLADVRELIERRLPANFREKTTWRVVAKDLEAAALGADPAEVSIALRMVLMLEGVECQAK